tara:strand:+ start:40762 stop:41631 length:870 start_codon:yes stop_codon:yes gene_type:complete
MGIQNFTNLDTYYEDDSQWGNHQYVTIKTIVNNFVYEQDDDSYVANTDRNKVVMQAKRGVQELYYDVVNEIISIEIELTPALIIALPHDYINYVRISWVDDNGKLHPLAVDKSYNLAQAYLQDHDYNFLYDSEGDILQGSHIQESGLIASQDLTVDGELSTSYQQRNLPFNVDRSKIFKNGRYRIDKERGIIQFSSDVTGRIIVLDYLSDGLFQRDDADIRINKFAEEAMYAFIYYKLISRKRNVPDREKRRAEKEWFNYKRIAKRRVQSIKYEEIRQVLKGGSKWIKD